MERGGRPLSLAAAVGVLVVVAGVLIGLGPLDDNSFLTHLATGRLILDRSHVPSSDPYSFSAPGAAWVVQSWLASVLYASLEAIGGLGSVRILGGVLTGTLAAVAWGLLRPATGIVVRLGLATIFLVIGAGVWAERPLMFGLVAFALTMAASERMIDPRWLLPVGWVWVNTHGSFPLGVVYLVAVGLGSRLDGEGAAGRWTCLRWLLTGVGLGIVGPLGLSALTFPVELLAHQEVLKHVLEWQAPAFTSISQRAFLVEAAAFVVLLVRRPTYRAAIPGATFIAAALLGSRNIALASLVLLPPTAAALADFGGLAASARRRSLSIVVTLALVLGVAVGLSRLSEPDLRLTAYPVRSLAFLENHDVDLKAHRLATRELVGNLLTYVYGPGQRVFYDDRFDMYPAEVSDAALAMDAASPGVFADLEDFAIELLITPRESALALAVVRDPGWRVLVVEEQWQLSCQRGSELGGALGRC
jgi:hypothetical protein